MIKYVVIIQCELAHNRCSGFLCTNAFYSKTGTFSSYSSDVKYISFTCGGCCGKAISAKLENFYKHISKFEQLSKDEIAIHLASCMTTNNHHYNRCPNIDYIYTILERKDYSNVIEGSYISKCAEEKRSKNIY